MPLVPLRNQDWGFDSNCFVCEQANHGGLRIAFAYDTDRERVVASFVLDATFSGAPTYLHGGVSLAVLDEAQAWATIAVRHRFAVTASTASRFARPVRVGRSYRVEAWITGGEGDRIRTAAAIYDAKDRVCVDSDADFVVLGEAQALDAIGGAVGDELRGYLRD